MFSHILKIFLLFCLVSVLCLSYNYIFAQENLEEVCYKTAENDFNCQGMTAQNCRKLLEDCAQYYQDQSDKISEDLTKTAEQKKTLNSQISTLKNKLKNLQYQINQGNIIIKDLSLQITETKSSIDKISLQIEQSKDQISNILRVINEEGDKSSLEILLEGNLSDFFNNIVYLENLNSKLNALLKNTTDLKVYLDGQKNKMDDEKDQTEKTVKIQALQKQESESTKKEQESLLKMTEAQYQQQLQQKKEVEEKSAKIRARLFQLVGVSKVPTFGEALDVAKTVASLIGIRSSFLLAIISQESSIGRNVGQCILTNTTTGAGKRISNGVAIYRLMKPSRDVVPFLKITTDLGRDPYNTPVSCPLSIGWGGAMGPAQFIPSTWILYADKLKNMFGIAGDPWGIKDSFTAAALYLYDLGASAKTITKESNAASRYYGGSSSYAKQVMSRAKCIQSFIDTDTMSSNCQNLIF